MSTLSQTCHQNPNFVITKALIVSVQSHHECGVVRVEVDVSEIPDWCYYIDEKCKELEEQLKEYLVYCEYGVRRMHMADDWTDDPYVLLQPIGEEALMLESWEFEALSPSEILLLIEYESETYVFDVIEYALLCLFIAGMLMLGIPAVFLVPQLVMGLADPFLLSIIQLSTLILIISATLYSRKHGSRKAKTAHQRVHHERFTLRRCLAKACSLT